MNASCCLTTVMLAVLPLTASAQGTIKAAAAASRTGRRAGGSVLTAAVDSTVREFMRHEKIPALSAAVAMDGVVRWEHAWGWADLEQGVPATRATLYRIASEAKAITTVAVLQLAERGRIALDAPIQRYVPEYPEKPYPVTVGRLLAATSGLRTYRGDEGLSTVHYPTLTSSLAIFRNDPLAYVPGTAYLETPYGFTLLGLAVEAVAGQPFMEYVREHVFRPAGMLSTREDALPQVIRHRARTYSRDNTGAVVNAPPIDGSYKVPAGGMISTAGDMARFGAALLGGRLIDASDLALMTARVRLTNGQALPLGLGVAVGKSTADWPGDSATVWLAGIQQGATSVAYLDARRGIVVSILVNMNGKLGSDAGTLLKRLAGTAAWIAGRLPQGH